MPIKVFSSSQHSTGTTELATPLIPGVEPGGSRAGQPFKPALLIRDIQVQWQEFVPGLDSDLVNAILVLSQEQDLTPGMHLDVSSAMAGATDTTLAASAAVVQKLERSHSGTVWAPAWVGIRGERSTGTMSTWRFRLLLDYEVIMIPWVEWFLRWEYLDNIVDAEREY